MATLTRAGFPPVTRGSRSPRTWPIHPADIVAAILAVGLLVAGITHDARLITTRGLGRLRA